MVAIDTDVLVLAFAYHRDERQETNTHFLDAVRTDEPSATIYTVMELLGRLSFNLPAQKLSQWSYWLQDAYQLTVLYPQPTVSDPSQFFRNEFVDQPLEHMQQVNGIPYLDSLIIGLAERAQVESFVTWNARHFRAKTSTTVITPAEYLAQIP